MFSKAKLGTTELRVQGNVSARVAYREKVWALKLNGSGSESQPHNVLDFLALRRLRF